MLTLNICVVDNSCTLVDNCISELAVCDECTTVYNCLTTNASVQCSTIRAISSLSRGSEGTAVDSSLTLVPDSSTTVCVNVCDYNIAINSQSAEVLNTTSIDSTLALKCKSTIVVDSIVVTTLLLESSSDSLTTKVEHNISTLNNLQRLSQCNILSQGYLTAEHSCVSKLLSVSLRPLLLSSECTILNNLNIDIVAVGKNITLQSSKVVSLYWDISSKLVLLDKLIILVKSLEDESNNGTILWSEEVVSEDSVSITSLVCISLDSSRVVANCLSLASYIASISVETYIDSSTILNRALSCLNINLSKLIIVGSHNTQLSERTVKLDVDRLCTVEVISRVSSSKCVTSLIHSYPSFIEGNVGEVRSFVVVVYISLAVYNISPYNELIVTVRDKTNRE